MPEQQTLDIGSSTVVFSTHRTVGIPSAHERQNYLIPIRYSVHRDVGEYTPMVFDVYVRFDLTYLKNTVGENRIDPIVDVIQQDLDYVDEPWIRNALMVDHESPFLVSLLKGREYGSFNRKDTFQEIAAKVRDQGWWYSHRDVPTKTIQEQRIVSYDKTTHKMRDPLSPLKMIDSFLATKWANSPSAMVATYLPHMPIEYAIVNGMTVEQN